jgi:hypothetical protein
MQVGGWAGGTAGGWVDGWVAAVFEGVASYGMIRSLVNAGGQGLPQGLVRAVAELGGWVGGGGSHMFAGWCTRL